jgi:hypothetical protein
MTIEFYTPYKMVSEQLVNAIRKELLNLSHINKKISRAEVMMREESNITGVENKVCEIRLNIYGDNMFSHSRTANFEESAMATLKELKRMTRQQVKKTKELPDELLSSVKG